MSDRSNGLNTGIDFTATTVSLAVSQYLSPDVSKLLDTIQEQKDLQRILSAFVIVIIFAIAKAVLKYVISFVLDFLGCLRRWIFFRDQYIEGLWFDIIRQNQEIISIGHSRICYSNGKYQISGEDFSVKIGSDCKTLFSSSSPDNDREDHGHYCSESVASDWPNLKYVFIYNGGHRGCGEATFINNHDPEDHKYWRGHNYEKYHGFFVHFATGERFTYEGFLIKKSKQPKLIDKAHILEFLKKEKLLPQDCGNSSNIEKSNTIKNMGVEAPVAGD